MNKLPNNIRNLSNRPDSELNMGIIKALTMAEIDYISEIYERGNVSGLGIAMLMSICVAAGVLFGWFMWG